MSTHIPTLTTAVLTPKGLQLTGIEATSLADAVQYEPRGVYTVSRTYHRTFTLELDAHLDRLEESARLKGIALTLDRAALRAALRQVIEMSGNPESRFRLTVPDEQPDHVYIAVEPLNGVPPEVRSRGVQVRSFPTRRSNPRSKDTNWMISRVELQAQMGDDHYEGLLTGPGGEILEGLSSNFYAVKDAALHTADHGILYGISRRILLTVAQEVLPVRKAPVTLADIPQLSEAMLTSSSRGVVPIVGIDGQTINGGTPGPITRELAARYNTWADDHLEAL